MEQENIQQDTPQPAKEHASLEEAIFGSNDEGSNDLSDVFTTGKEETTTEAPVIGQPEVSTEVKQETTQDNDTTRYQYWQSQADKMKAENQRLQTAMQQQQQMQQVPQVQQPVQEAPVEQAFPPPPEKPGKPGQFSREEAYSDPSSESARYIDAVESWRDDMTEYNGLKSQYDAAIVQEKVEKIEATRVQEAQRQEAFQRDRQQKNEVYKYVTGHHGLSKEQAVDFINTMSQPESVNVDNLVALYRLNKGGSPQQANPGQPSETFQQMKNAQQVPSPMGVMPSGQSNADGRSLEDKIMDTMIGNFNSKNPWK